MWLSREGRATERTAGPALANDILQVVTDVLKLGTLDHETDMRQVERGIKVARFDREARMFAIKTNRQRAYPHVQFTDDILSVGRGGIVPAIVGNAFKQLDRGSKKGHNLLLLQPQTHVAFGRLGQKPESALPGFTERLGTQMRDEAEI
ncbi:MAG: hypothetical protein PVSMB7_06300 [Chloroflexota bacterium]